MSKQIPPGVFSSFKIAIRELINAYYVHPSCQKDVVEKCICWGCCEGRASSLIKLPAVEPPAVPVEMVDPFWGGFLAAIKREEGRNNLSKDNAPGHSHEVPGIWDSDNGKLAGVCCAWCMAWNEAKRRLRDGVFPAPVPVVEAEPIGCWCLDEDGEVQFDADLSWIKAYPKKYFPVYAHPPKAW